MPTVGNRTHKMTHKTRMIRSASQSGYVTVSEHSPFRNLTDNLVNGFLKLLEVNIGLHYRIF